MLWARLLSVPSGSRVTHHPTCVAPSLPDPERLKAEITRLGGKPSLRRPQEATLPSLESALVQLEESNPTERPASSPLLDGMWSTQWFSSAPRWTRLPFVSRTMWHHIDTSHGKGGPGRYTQRVRVAGIFLAHATGSICALGGGDLRVEYERYSLSFLGIPLFRRSVYQFDADLDHALRPTFLDGDSCVLRADAVCAGPSRVLRPARTYVLRRDRHALWQPNPETEPPMPSWLPEA